MRTQVKEFFELFPQALAVFYNVGHTMPGLAASSPESPVGIRGRPTAGGESTLRPLLRRPESGRVHRHAEAIAARAITQDVFGLRRQSPGFCFPPVHVQEFRVV